MTSNNSFRRVKIMPNKIALALVIGAVTLMGCPGPTAPPPPPPAPFVLSFTASAAEVEPGQSVTLTWETEHATSVELRDVDRGVVSGVDPQATSGSVEVQITANALFTLTATNERGARHSAAVAVRASTGASDVQFVAAPATITAGESATLAWSAPGAKTVKLETASGTSVPTDGQVQTGSVVVRPTASTTYHLTVDGNVFSATVRVAPVVAVFEAQPASVSAGQPVTLMWQTTGATTVSLHGAGRGPLYETTDPAEVADGTYTETMPLDLDPAAVHSYILRATSEQGETTEATVTLYVTGAPEIVDVQIPRYAPGGLTFPVSWETKGADIVEILRDGQVIFVTSTLEGAISGSVEVPTPPTEATFVLRARHSRGGSVTSDPHPVEPVGVPTITSFEATPTHIANGGTPVTLTFNAPNARTAVIAVENGPVVRTLTGPDAEGVPVIVYPNADTTYTLTVDNGIGNVDGPWMETVTVATPAGLVFDPPAAPVGGIVEVTGPTFSGATGVRGQPLYNLASSRFEDISTTGVDIAYPANFTSTAYVHELSQPFRTTLFGETVDVTHVNITINGWFSFGNTATGGGTNPSATTRLPSTALEPWAFAPFWYDLRSTNSTKVYHQVDGVAPNRRLILQWTNVRLEAVTNSNLTFQVRIHEDGTVIFAYRELDGITGHEPSVGFVNGNETAFEVLGGSPQSYESYTWNLASVPFPFEVIASDRPYEYEVEISGGYSMVVSDSLTVIPPNQFSVTEINVNPLVPNGQWFELENHTTAPIDLGGWEIDFGGGVTHVIGSGLTLPAGGRLVLAQSPGAGDGVAVDYVYGAGLAFAPGNHLAVTVAQFPYADMWVPPVALPAGRTWQRGSPAAGLTVIPGVTSVECLAADSAVYGTAGQIGSPGGPNTSCPQYEAPVAIPGAFEPIASTGTQLTFANLNNDLAMIQLPVPVVLDRVSFQQLWVSTNGYISPLPMSCPQYCYSTNKTALNPVEAPAGVIAPFWDDVDTTNAGGVYWERKSAGPVGYTIVSWEGVHRFDGPTDVLNFQVKFFDNGDIEFHYGTMQSPVLNSATTWIEHPYGTAAFIINVNSATPGISSNSGYRLAAL